MSTLPWDELQPEEPELPYVPPDDLGPPPVEMPTWPKPGWPKVPGDTLPADAIEKALDDLWPAIKDKALDYAKDSWGEIREGHTVDILHPTVTAETAAGKELIVADAKSRSWRTLVQGLIFDVFAAIVAAVALLSGADPFVKETWLAFGVLLLKSVVSAVISYFMRLRVQPTIKLETDRIPVMPVPQPEERRSA